MSRSTHDGGRHEDADACAGMWTGTAFLGTGWLLYGGPLGATDLHRHHAIQVIVARRGVVHVRDVRGRSIETAAAVIAADVPHATADATESAYLLYLEPDSAIGRCIGAPMAHAAADWDHHAAFDHVARQPMPTTIVAARVLAQDVARTVGRRIPRARSATRHPAVSRALCILPTMVARRDRAVHVSEVAAAVGASESRFSRVFNACVGISVPAYIRWLRLRIVTESLQRGRSLTEAAHDAGFSDGAHLSRVFRSTFGVRPSELTGGVRWQVCGLDLTDPFKPAAVS